MSKPIIWKTPAAMLKDWKAFVEERGPGIRTDKRVVKNKDGTFETKEVDFYYPGGVISIIQFAAWKKIHKTTIYNDYSKGDFEQAYKLIKAASEAYSEEQLYAKDHPTGVIFALKNNHEWVDETKTELSGGLHNKTEMSPEAAAILAKATRAGDGITEPI